MTLLLFFLFHVNEVSNTVSCHVMCLSGDAAVRPVVGGQCCHLSRVERARTSCRRGHAEGTHQCMGCRG